MNLMVYKEDINPMTMVERRRMSIDCAVGSNNPTDKQTFFKQITSPTKFDRWASQQTISETPAYDSLNSSVEISMNENPQSNAHELIDITNKEKENPNNKDKRNIDRECLDVEFSPIKIQNFDAEEIPLVDLSNSKKLSENELSLVLNNTLAEFFATYEKITQEDIESYNSKLIRKVTKKTAHWKFDTEIFNGPELAIGNILPEEFGEIDDSIISAFNKLEIKRESK